MAVLASYPPDRRSDHAQYITADAARPRRSTRTATTCSGTTTGSRVVYGARVSLISGVLGRDPRFACRPSHHRACLRHGALGRRHHHARHGWPDVDPADPARGRSDGADARQRRQRHSGDHRRGDAARIAAGARRRAVAARAALCRRSRRGRNPHADDHPAPHPAEHARADDGASHVHLRQRHDHRGNPLVHRRRRPANHAVVGNIMAEGRALWQAKPFIVFFPAIFLSLTVLAVNLLGDGTRDALDPRLAKGLSPWPCWKSKTCRLTSAPRRRGSCRRRRIV